MPWETPRAQGHSENVGGSKGKRSAGADAERRRVMGIALRLQSLLDVAHDDDEAVPSCATASNG